ncbi:4-hydroxy-tetrahydrodipicolinate reductase [Tepiditoga spiralis]|uniref:4-hydroxy-tetrahydrodipicolinate reductase n=1 Tax=Tepiditoga spiralis TaxID=2108365 RepID=A0A7G1GB55_9BACT|nr:dihydrodipicolinate reductase C-terminal domain-containing protein [Tepiditoga spiralis]BBE30859.1 4-hydroxy-tetrahydrodipicolinate reductase [Tepiditoga spiralis]
MKYGLIGINGRMGREIQNLFDENNHELVFSYDKNGEFFKENPDILIDFSLPKVFNTTIEYVKKYNTPLIIGTTDLDEKSFNVLKDISKKVPIVQSYNFSIGIQILLKLAKLTNDFLPNSDIEIIETHHRFKKDKPSGTAKMIKNELNKNINISSLRIGNIPGDHKIIFGTLGETIGISHRALSRRAFAEGVLKSALFLKKVSKSKIYTFSEVMEGKI